MSRPESSPGNGGQKSVWHLSCTEILCKPHMLNQVVATEERANRKPLLAARENRGMSWRK